MNVYIVKRVKSGPRGIYSRELYATTNVYYVSLHFWLPK